MIRKLAEGEVEADELMFGEIWDCTTCRECEMSCPARVEIVEAVVGTRSIFVEEGRVPRTGARALESVFRFGNPWRLPKVERALWSSQLQVKDLTRGERGEVLLFVGCAPSYDLEARRMAQAAAEVLRKLGVDFCILGAEELCCGNEVLKMGEEGLFEFLRERNLESFKRYEVREIVTLSPHCFNALRNLYDLPVPVRHYTQFILPLLEERKGLLRRFERRVAYHDPCYLGRHNGIYEEPRRILKLVPGLELLEFEQNRERSLCCEGGGGRMWVEASRRGMRLSRLIAREARRLGAEIIATSCPFCLLNILDAVKTEGLEEEIKVFDILEILREVLS